MAAGGWGREEFLRYRRCAVVDVRYPAVLFWTGDNDTRVDPLHPRKMTALMQAEAAPGRPILIRYDTLTGHSGGRAVKQQLDLDTDLLAFLTSPIG